jgi:hypothetical protein
MRLPAHDLTLHVETSRLVQLEPSSPPSLRVSFQDPFLSTSARQHPSATSSLTPTRSFVAVPCLICSKKIARLKHDAMWQCSCVGEHGDAESATWLKLTPTMFSSSCCKQGVQKQSKDAFRRRMYGKHASCKVLMQHASLDNQPHTPVHPPKPQHFPIAALSVRPFGISAVQIGRARSTRDHPF